MRLKKFFVFTFFSVFFSVSATKVVQAYTLTLKPKFDCPAGKVMVQGGCIESDLVGS